MEFGNVVRVETSRYLTKITTLRRKDDRCPQVLAAKHTASLQLLCTVGGDLAGPRTVAKFFFFRKKKLISLRYAGSPNRHQLYIVIEAKLSACTQVLVARGN